jgi:hypothetical protein
MVVLRQALLFLHLIGFALLLGGAVTQFLTGTIRINSAMWRGAAIQVVTGFALAAPFGLDGEKLNHAALAVKVLIGLAIFVMVFVPRRRETVDRGHFMAIVGLILVNAAVAVFWL